MIRTPVSRRGFLSSALGLTAAGPQLTPDFKSTASPSGWIILERDWEYTDQCDPCTGDRLRSQLFLSEAAARAQCQLLCDDFYATVSIPELSNELETYLGEREPNTMSWTELREEGFLDPFFVQQLLVTE